MEIIYPIQRFVPVTTIDYFKYCQILFTTSRVVNKRFWGPVSGQCNTQHAPLNCILKARVILRLSYSVTKKFLIISVFGFVFETSWQLLISVLIAGKLKKKHVKIGNETEIY